MTDHELPSGWAIVALGDILLSLETGKRPKGGAVNDPSGVLSISAEHMDQLGRVDTSIPRFVPRDFYEKMKVGHLKSGDVLVVKDGATTGKTAYVDATLGRETLVVNEHVFICRTSLSSIEPHWVFHCLWSESGQSQIRACLRGSAQGGIIRSFVDDVSMPLPPLPEQRRIVAAIEHHFSRLDAAVASLERAQANLKRYRTSVLKAACEGELVPTEAHLAKSEGRGYEPADQLLARVLAERRARWQAQAKRGRKYKEPVAPATSELPQLPEGWVWASVDQVSHRIQYGTSSKASSDANGIPVLRMGNIQNGELDLSDLKYLSVQDVDVGKTLLERGDLLFNRTNSAELVGKCAVFKGTPSPACFASYLIRVTFISVVPKLAAAYMNSQFGRRYIGQVRSQQVGQANVNGTKLAAMPIPLPPLAEQRRIVAEVERRLSAIQQAEAAVEANLARAERLRQSILKQAFSGKLVPQNPTDEPASALLDRIRAEREAALAAAKSRRKPNRRHAGKARARKATAP